jgi:hypothetical protein
LADVRSAGYIQSMHLLEDAAFGATITLAEA